MRKHCELVVFMWVRVQQSARPSSGGHSDELIEKHDAESGQHRFFTFSSPHPAPSSKRFLHDHRAEQPGLGERFPVVEQLLHRRHGRLQLESLAAGPRRRDERVELRG